MLISRLLPSLEQQQARKAPDIVSFDALSEA